MASHTVSQLFQSCRDGNLSDLKDLITKQRVNPNDLKDSSGLTPLHIACKYGCLNIAQYLIQCQKCNPKTGTPTGHTPLHSACENGHFEVAKFLITEHKCRPERGDVNGFTPLHSAASKGHLEVVKYLITVINENHCVPECGNVDGYTPLHLAAHNGHFEVVKYLTTEHHFSPERGNADGYTPLHLAASNGQLKVVRYLITEHKCSLECGNVNGYTPLHLAASNGQLEVVKYLITEHKCSPERGSSHGYTPLHLAAHNGQLEVVWYLVTERQHSLECGNVDGYTPLHLAASNGQLEVVKYLISEHGCNPHITTNDGHTPLHCALGHSTLNTITTKYDCNCNPECLRSKRHVPVYAACQDSRAEVAKYLSTEHKCSSKQDATPIIPATFNGDAIQDFGAVDTNEASGMINQRKNDAHVISKTNESGGDSHDKTHGDERSFHDSQIDKPSLINCIRFQGREKTINIPQEIGADYYKFGLFILEDDNGARIRSIAHKHRDNAEQINMEVLQQWLTGKGKHPITWKTLTEVLHSIGLKTLAREIEIVKCPENLKEETNED